MLSTSILYCNNIYEHTTLQGLISSDRCSNVVNCSHHHHHASNNNHQTSSIYPKSSSYNRSQTKSETGATSNSVISAFSNRSCDLRSHNINKANNSRYRVQYLGCNTCDNRTHKPENGIATYQKPLLDLYCTVLKRSAIFRSLLAVNQVADLSLHGIFIAEKDRFQAARQQTRPGSSVSTTSKLERHDTIVTKVITPLSNILLWAAVRLQHRTHMRKINKNSGIKRRQIGVAFVPLSCSEAVLDKNAFVTLNSKQRFLLGLPHPPLFVCVLQKVNSNQRLECHMFVCSSSEDAIRMCNQMNELRQRASSIGSLHIPPPGQMGKYSYQNRLYSSSSGASSSIFSRCYSPSTNTMSELSISTSSKGPRFSDIEEEDDDDDNDVHRHHHEETEVKKLIDSYQSNIASSTNSNNNNNNLKQGIKIIHNNDLSGQLFNNNNNNRGNNSSSKIKCDARLYDRTKLISKGVNHHNQQYLVVNGNSPSELSSLSSSKSISTNNMEPNKRLISNSNDQAALMAQRDYRFESYKRATTMIGGESTVENIGNSKMMTPNSSIKIIDNRKFDAQNHQSLNDQIDFYKQNSSTKTTYNNNKWTKKNDELQKNRLFAKASAKTYSNRENDQDTTPMPSDVQDSNISGIKTFFGDSMRGKKNLPIRNSKENSKNGDQKKQYNHSIISSSIFLDNEDEKSFKSNKSKESSSQKSKTRKNRIQKTNITEVVKKENINNKIENNKSRHHKEIDKPLKLYLPENNANLGVKGFNKNSRVETWSTMIAQNSCELCNMELNCDECCSFCQAIEQHKRQFCMECFQHDNSNDDFILDDMTMQNFNMKNGQRSNGHLKRSESQTIRRSSDPSFFNRIRRLNWQTLFSSRKKLNGSRIWSRLRTGSQRLRGSKRYFQNKSRIFLPNSPQQPKNVNNEKSVEKEKDEKKNHHYSYDEHYLKLPASSSTIMEPVLSMVPSLRTTTNQHHHEEDIEKINKFNSNTRTNEKITETNNKDVSNDDDDVKINENNKNRNKITSMMTKSSNVIQQQNTTATNNNNNNNTIGNLALLSLDQDHGKQNILMTTSSSILLTEQGDNDDEPKFLLNNESSSIHLHDDSNPIDFIKPFFITHPGNNNNNSNKMVANINSIGQFETKVVELGLNGISISSDSGMEEYDFYSSAEHSPSGYHNHNHNHYNNRLRSEIKQQKHQQCSYDLAKQTTKKDPNLNYSLYYHQPTVTKHEQLELERQRNMMINKVSSKFSKDIRRQAGHWSNTNLESQLGYMP